MRIIFLLVKFRLSEAFQILLWAMQQAPPASRIGPARLIFAALTCLFWFGFANGNELQKFEGCRLIEQDWTDGDSFMVELPEPDGREIVLRLYYVDCIEQTVSTTSDKRRLREQARYFGIEDYRIAVEFGKEAARFTIEALSEPFTIYTSFADARGRSGKPRYYAFIETSERKDLARLLVENGLARAFGMSRETPSGTHRDEWEIYLSDLEFAAALRRTGAWAQSNPEAITQMRADEREEMRGLEAIDDAFTVRPPDSPIDLNSASLEDLTRTGLRESLADAVILYRQKRRFKSVEQLMDVRGIGPVTLDKVRPYVEVSIPTPAP